MQTNFNKVIGGYNPDQWEETTGMKSFDGFLDYKGITSGSPFLFYWANDQIEIIKHQNYKIPIMKSDKNALMVFGWGLYISAVKNGYSTAIADPFIWVLP